VLVRTASHAVLYDAGPAWGERDAGASTVVPAARSLGVDDLDLLVVSHDDLDHAGGAASVRSALEPALILLGDARSKVRLGNVGEQCSEVRRFQYDAVNVTVFPGVSSGNDNDRSCVMHVSAGGQSLLVPGDSSRRREIALLEDYGNALAADVLVAGHHGSRSATAPTFLYRVAPAQVIFLCRAQEPVRASPSAGDSHDCAPGYCNARHGFIRRNLLPSGCRLAAGTAWLAHGNAAVLAPVTTAPAGWGGRRCCDRLGAQFFMSPENRLVLEIIKAGGWVMWPIIGGSIVAMAIVIERFMTLRASRIAPAGLAARTWQQIREGKFNRDQLKACVRIRRSDSFWLPVSPVRVKGAKP
jgi:hypothetical protein